MSFGTQPEVAEGRMVLFPLVLVPGREHQVPTTQKLSKGHQVLDPLPNACSFQLRVLIRNQNSTTHIYTLQFEGSKVFEDFEDRFAVH